MRRLGVAISELMAALPSHETASSPVPMSLGSGLFFGFGGEDGSPVLAISARGDPAPKLQVCAYGSAPTPLTKRPKGGSLWQFRAQYPENGYAQAIKQAVHVEIACGDATGGEDARYQRSGPHNPLRSNSHHEVAQPVLLPQCRHALRTIRRVGLRAEQGSDFVAGPVHTVHQSLLKTPPKGGDGSAMSSPTIWRKAWPKSIVLVCSSLSPGAGPQALIR
jgi:hypothetical protein